MEEHGGEEHDQQQLQLQPLRNNNEVRQSHLAIQDEAEWFRRNTLHGGPLLYGSESVANQQEAKERVLKEQLYQEKLHSHFFEEQDAVRKRKRERQLEEWKDQTLLVDTHPPLRYNLRSVAERSDTVLALAHARQYYQGGDTFTNCSDADAILKLPENLVTSSTAFEMISSFFDLLLQPEYTEDSVSEEYVVDCCRLAHYLQCTDLLEFLVPILVRNVDSENCWSLCQLADQLHLPNLLEASMTHVLKHMDQCEDESFFPDFPDELKERIQQIRSLLTVSSKTRREIYFSSFHEYLALLAEQVQYYQERLGEARDQQSRHDAYSKGWAYAQAKIEQQSLRVERLRQVYRTQKKLFGRTTEEGSSSR